MIGPSKPEKMRMLTINLPSEFIAEVDAVRKKLVGVRSRSATLHFLADLGLRYMGAHAEVHPALLVPVLAKDTE